MSKFQPCFATARDWILSHITKAFDLQTPHRDRVVSLPTWKSKICQSKWWFSPGFPCSPPTGKVDRAGLVRGPTVIGGVMPLRLRWIKTRFFKKLTGLLSSSSSSGESNNLSRSEIVTCKSFSVRSEILPLGVGGEARHGRTCSVSCLTGSCFTTGSFAFLSCDFLFCRRALAFRLVLDEVGAGEAADPVLLALLARPRGTGTVGWKTESWVSAAIFVSSGEGAGIWDLLVLEFRCPLGLTAAGVSGLFRPDWLADELRRMRFTGTSSSWARLSFVGGLLLWKLEMKKKTQKLKPTRTL